MDHVIAHDLDVATAKKVIDQAFAHYQKRYAHYQPTFRWINERKGEAGFSAMAVTLRGTVALREGEIAVEADIPFLLRPFRKRAMDVIDREVKVWLGKAKAGEI